MVINKKERKRERLKAKFTRFFCFVAKLFLTSGREKERSRKQQAFDDNYFFVVVLFTLIV